MIRFEIDKNAGKCHIEAVGSIPEMTNDVLHLLGSLYFETKRRDKWAALRFCAGLLSVLANEEYWDRDWSANGGYQALNLSYRAKKGNE